MTHLSLVEQPMHCISDDEDYIALYEYDGSYIYYVRNYFAETEFLLLSQDLILQLDEEYRAVSGVYLRPYFSVLKYFEHEVIQYVLCNAQLIHFHYLFNCTVSELFQTL